MSYKISVRPKLPRNKYGYVKNINGGNGSTSITINGGGSSQSGLPYTTDTAGNYVIGKSTTIQGTIKADTIEATNALGFRNISTEGNVTALTSLQAGDSGNTGAIHVYKNGTLYGYGTGVDGDKQFVTKNEATAVIDVTSWFNTNGGIVYHTVAELANAHLVYDGTLTGLPASTPSSRSLKANVQFSFMPQGTGPTEGVARFEFTFTPLAVTGHFLYDTFGNSVALSTTNTYQLVCYVHLTTDTYNGQEVVKSTAAKTIKCVGVNVFI